ncbi:MAG: zf-HC2 domain-containing protein [Actinobacteria bacterium]|nr:MAG: zf-HC2 domain-containing protein [Actinomycetota bacterium]TMM26302.1 MAG: zf-HC2 domain-containing protein [Actinomycetota bacterium]
MGALTQLDHQCARTRELLSLELDGELSQLDSARLESHLAHCPQCRALKTELAGLTLALRTAPLEQLERPISLPRRMRWSLRPLQVGAAAAAIAIAAGLAGLSGTVRGHAPAQPRFVSGTSGPADSLNALRTLRRPGLIPQVQVPVGRAGGRPTV